MLGVPLLVFLAAMTQASFAAEINKKAGGEKAKSCATVEGLIGIDCPNAVIADAGLVAGEKMNIPTTTLVSSSAKNEAATEIKTNATGGAGIMPEETVLFSENKKVDDKKFKVENQTCTCAKCIQNNTGAIGGNYS